MDKKIDFFIIGSQKCGTTSLYALLAQHKSIYLPIIKENPYFINTNFYKNNNYLDRYYNKKDIVNKRVGFSHANMLHCDYCPERIIRHNNSAKLIVILREPISRAFSAYRYAVKNSREKEANSFEEALALEEKRMMFGSESRERRDLCYFENSKYHKHLKNYLNWFNKKQIFICTICELEEDPEKLINKISCFLDIEACKVDYSQGKQNTRGEVKSKLIQKLLFNNQTEFRRLVLKSLPSSLINIIKKIKLIIYNLNLTESSQKESISKEMKNKLEVYFQDDLSRLKNEFGISLLQEPSLKADEPFKQNNLI